jgi:hypothetical protein
MIDLTILKTRARWLLAGFVLTFASSFGRPTSSPCSATTAA